MKINTNQEQLAADVAEKIAKYGMAIVGEFRDHLGSTRAYTVGMGKKFGYELLVVGLPPDAAFPIMQLVIDHLQVGFEFVEGESYSEFTDLPFEVKSALWDRVVGSKLFPQLVQHYEGREVPRVLQLAFSDRNGQLSSHPEYEREYMLQFMPHLWEQLEALN